MLVLSFMDISHYDRPLPVITQASNEVVLEIVAMATNLRTNKPIADNNYYDK